MATEDFLSKTAFDDHVADLESLKTQMETLYDNFDDRYLGEKASDPSTDNDGNALIDGALYWNTTSDSLKVYDLGNTTWVDPVALAEAAKTAAEAAQSAAETAESNASTSATNAATSESNAATSETNAATSASSAATSESNAATSETNAAASEAKAQDWAEEAEDVEVETGQYSAKHYSIKSKDYSREGIRFDGVEADRAAVEAIVSPTEGDSYYVVATNEGAVFDGTDWQYFKVGANAVAGSVQARLTGTAINVVSGQTDDFQFSQTLTDGFLVVNGDIIDASDYTISTDTVTLDTAVDSTSEVYWYPIEETIDSDTGVAITFTKNTIWNTPASPGTGNITDDLTGAKIARVQKIYHNAGTEPTVPAGWVKLNGSQDYVTSSLNIIFAEWVSGTRVEFWIVQEA